MNRFEFAGFSFPRPVGTFARGKREMLKKREQRRYTGCYYHAPTPNQGRGWGFYDVGWDEGCSFNLRLIRGDGFTNLDTDQEFTSIVARLPHGRGFLAGWTMGGHMAASLGARVFDDEDDAMRAAEDEARAACEEDSNRGDEE